MSDLIGNVAKFTPCEFQRRPRSLSELEHFKATEFRSLIIYFGPYLLKSYLPVAYYNHFLLLHFSIYVFVSNRFTHLYSLAARCIDIFVSKMERLFGKESMSYNVHILRHLHEFVLMYGPLDQHSSFPYENHLSHIKRRVKKTRMIFKQSLTQLINLRSIYTNLPVHDLQFSSKAPNNCALLSDGKLLLIDSVNQNTVGGVFLKFSESLYSYPYDSEGLQIGFYSLTSKRISNAIPLTKAVCIPVKSKYLVIPFA
jgi:hypothetical protein